jgi:hypothetical protein
METDWEKKALRAIRRKCLDCSGGSPEEADRCEVYDCPLHPFRRGLPAVDGLGKRGKGTEAPQAMTLLLPGVK